MEMESRTKKTSRNVVYATISQFIKIILVFISRKIFINQLGASFLGVNGLFTNILSILSLADLGMSTTMMYCLYKPLANNNQTKITAYMNYFQKIYNIIAIVIALVGIAIIPLLKYIINLPTEIPYIYVYYLLILFNSIISYLFIYKTTLLQADQKMFIINKYDTIFQVVLFVLQVFVLLLTNSFALYLGCNILCTFIGNIFKAKATEKIYPYLKDNKKNIINKSEKKELFKNSYSLFFYKLGGIIQSNTDNILISLFIGTITVGYYSNYSTIILQITTFITIIFTALKASIGNYVTEKNTESQYEMFEILEVYNFWIVSFCSICFFMLVPNFIELLFGKEYLLSNIFLICTILNFYTSNIRQTLWVYRETTGIFSKTKYITLITAIINLILSIILGKICGLVGIVLATVIARMLYAWWKEPQIIYKDIFNKNVKIYFQKYILRLILTAFMCLILSIIFKFININNLFILLSIKAIICVVVVTLIYLMIYKKNKAYLFLIEKIVKKRRNI